MTEEACHPRDLERVLPDESADSAHGRSLPDHLVQIRAAVAGSLSH